MKLFKKMVFALLVSFLIFCPSNALATYFSVTGGGESTEYRVSCVRGGSRETIEISGGIGRYFIHHPNIRQYTITNTLLCQRKICDITTINASEYLLQFEKQLPMYWSNWHIVKPEGYAGWVLMPCGEPNDIYRRRIYIEKIPGRDSWSIESECTVGYNVMSRELAVVNFGPEVYGEVTDIVNFLTAIVHYPEFSNFIN